MKKLIAASALIGLCNIAVAADTPRLKHRFTEYANVISVKPVFRNIRHDKPRKECWIEKEERVVVREGTRQRFGQPLDRINSTRNYSNSDALVGGLIGGVIGNQLGKRGNRGARNGATIAGAIVGSVIANEARAGDVQRHRRQQSHNSHKPTTQTYEVERCRETTHTSYEKRIQSYYVTYEYRGQTLTTRMKRDPGNKLELQVNVVPVRH